MVTINREGYIGVIDKDIEIMKKLDYKIHFNKNNLNDESNFIPKSHVEKNKVEYYDYQNQYQAGLNSVRADNQKEKKRI